MGISTSRSLKHDNETYVTCHLPQDQHELDRQRVQSYILRWVFESRHIVPPMIKDMLLDGIRVLDVSCGPGLYVGNPFMDMAQDFHKSTFDSIDICNLMARKQEMDTIYHEEVKLSPPVGPQKLLDNFTFTPYNVVKEHRIPYPDDTFDYTQQSLVTLAYAKEDWKTVMLDLKRVTKPGGYIQLLEIDLCPQPLGDASGLWRDQVLQCFEDKRGLDIGIPKRLNQVLAEIGLIEIETRFVSVPVGSWGLDIGLLWEENLNSFLEAMRPYLVEAMQVTDEQYKKDRAAFQNELQNVKAFNNICIAWGRIPL
ncbi:uncharacterized protein EV154DRAFT_154289 [Mucor mucedo]|uniref:uncharacterized protein n=1 Tax=Mucor mucedo TaxID=29922 RepID=UPI002220737A|nr:uncharacterized protein EV154DRAFT_154289 [Mucor mucedo]KAI7866560.1 hypothetical protein EV154DRAFT_154289 [Mucor mucedo]